MKAEDKALMACRNYAHLSSVIRKLTREIAEHLAGCSGVNGNLQIPPLGASNEDWTKHRSDQTHLKAAYTPETVNYGGYPETTYLHEWEIEEELAKCPHCLAAHKAIQGRKTAKRSLAAMKRFIGKIGKEAT